MNKYHWLSLFFAFLAGVSIGVAAGYDWQEFKLKKEFSISKIIETHTDNRGLTSIIYLNAKNDTLALDYLTPQELKNYIK